MELLHSPPKSSVWRIFWGDWSMTWKGKLGVNRGVLTCSTGEAAWPWRDMHITSGSPLLQLGGCDLMASKVQQQCRLTAKVYVAIWDRSRNLWITRKASWPLTHRGALFPVNLGVMELLHHYLKRVLSKTWTLQKLFSASYASWVLFTLLYRYLLQVRLN